MIPEVRERYDQVRNGIIPQGYKQTALGIVPQEWEEFSLGEVYSERKQAGDPSLPVLSVSIHTGVSEGELDEETLGKKVKRIEDIFPSVFIKLGIDIEIGDAFINLYPSISCIILFNSILFSAI